MPLLQPMCQQPSLFLSRACSMSAPPWRVSGASYLHELHLALPSTHDLDATVRRFEPALR